MPPFNQADDRNLYMRYIKYKKTIQYQHVGPKETNINYNQVKTNEKIKNKKRERNVKYV